MNVERGDCERGTGKTSRWIPPLDGFGGTCLAGHFGGTGEHILEEKLLFQNVHVNIILSGDAGSLHCGLIEVSDPVNELREWVGAAQAPTARREGGDRGWGEMSLDLSDHEQAMCNYFVVERIYMVWRPGEVARWRAK